MVWRFERRFIDRSGAQVGTVEISSTESGWITVQEFQRDRMQHFRDHPREAAELVPHGIRITERSGYHGLRQEITITFPGQP